jgi:hypothetical protein
VSGRQTGVADEIVLRQSSVRSRRLIFWAGSMIYG